MDLSDRLSEIEERYERLQGEMASPDVARDPDRLRRLGKDLSELGEITDGTGLTGVDADGREAVLEAAGWDHFAGG